MSAIKPTITVAVPSYNKEKYIDRCLKSILHEKDFITEIMIVDNCSTDNTYQRAKKYEPDIKLYQNDTNLGMAGNWNKCIDLCKTDWLMIFHADDELLPGTIKKYLNFMQKFSSISLIHADSYSVIEDSGAPKELWQNNSKEFWRAGLDALSCPYGVCSAVIVKKESYEKLGYFIESVSSDAEMWARVAGKYDVGYMNVPTVVYYTNPSSTGYDSLINRSIKEIKADWDFLTENMAKAYPTKESRDAFLKDTSDGAPYTYWAVVRANIRAGNFLKATQAIFLIIFKYRGFISLVKLSFGAFKNKVLKK